MEEYFRYVSDDPKELLEAGIFAALGAFLAALVGKQDDTVDGEWKRV